MDVGEQCVVRDGGTQRLVWSVLDWDSQEKVNIQELLHIPTAYTELKRKLLLTGAMITQYSQGTLQSIFTLTCSSPQSDPPDCTAIPAPDNCDHSMDLGVRCLSHQEVCVSMHDESETTEVSKRDSTNLMTSNKILGALTGFLTAALLVVTIGWIASCVCLVRKCKQR